MSLRAAAVVGTVRAVALRPGIYEHLVTDRLAGELAGTPVELLDVAGIDRAEAADVLARHLAGLARRALRQAGSGEHPVARQVQLANEIAAAITRAGAGDPADHVQLPGRQLLDVAAPTPIGSAPARRLRPSTPLGTSALLVNGHGQPGIGREVARELASADRVDLLCAFIKWSGLRIIERELADARSRGVAVRVLTTTYLGATERRALDALVALGAQVRVSYDTRTTRLHAKAWLFRRATGLDTAYVGSSNLSVPALLDGLEWNVRLSGTEQPHLLDTFEGTFDSYWADPAFETYDPARDGDRLAGALAAERGAPRHGDGVVTALEVRPFGYQQEVLERLASDRELHGHHRSLVVMATGTGKTVVSALDYRRLRAAGTVRSLLFIAHRQEILAQSRAVFRQVLGRGDVGELFVGGEVPRRWEVVFASVQSLTRAPLPAPGHFDMVVVDEFHHAQAPTYARLLDHLRPKVLLGLTATPERGDGLDVRAWFDGRTAVDLRLWEALDRGVVAPFQYFGVHDETRLDRVAWRRGGYDAGELSRLYTGNDARLRLVLAAVRDRVAEPARMRALGFCVSIDHAEWMARRFTEAGLSSRAVTSRTGPAEREDALAALRDREVCALFTVDLFNEGIDLPTVDTVLFLRPTESATVFLQQLGRGLRLAPDKDCLTVLDFVGGQRAEFRFDLRYRALTGVGRRQLVREVEDDFPTLPSGCHLSLDPVAKQVVLDNVRSALRISRAGLAAELGRIGDCSLGTFLAETGVELADVYRQRGWGGWTGLRRAAGLDASPADAADARAADRFARLLHVDDRPRLDALADLAAGRIGDGPAATGEGRFARMVAAGVWALDGRSERPLAGVALSPSRRRELGELVEVLRDRVHRVSPTVASAGGRPLVVHATYTRVEALLAFGMADPGSVREGVKWFAEERADVFFVTLRKTEEHFSPTTRYADRAISPRVFQWESQSTTSVTSPTGQRYVHHEERGSSVHLFLRESRAVDGNLGAPAFLYAGTMRYLSHTGDRPMRITWRLDHPLPADVFATASVVAV